MARPGLTKHRKFARLTRLLGSVAVARGSLELLWDVAYENGDELLGTAEDLEFQAGWTGEKGQLAAALVGAEFIDKDGDLYRVHDLWDHAPDYVRRRLNRERQRRETGAKFRSLSSHPDTTDRSLTCQRLDTVQSVTIPEALALALKVKVKNTVAPGGATAPVSTEKRKAKPPKTELAEHAEKIVAYYEEQIRSHPPSRYRAREHIVSILKLPAEKGGVPWQVLWECVNQYEPEAARADVQFRKVAGNFFGRDAVYKAYLDAAQRELERYDAEKARRNTGADHTGAEGPDSPADARGVGG